MFRRLLVAPVAAVMLVFAAVAVANVKQAHFKPHRSHNVVTAPRVYKGHRVQRYAWERCSKSCSKIEGAHFRKHNLVKADRGAKLRVLISVRERNQIVTLASGELAIPSAQTPPIAPPDPVNTAVPVLSGTAEQGQVLTGTQGTWQNAVSFNDQWEDCDSSGANCTAITGATGLSYTLTASDVGHTVRLLVTAFNTSQGAAQAGSADVQIGT